MGASKIEWTDFTFNPWRGCTKITAGCDHCYAERDMSCKFHGVQWGPNAERRIKAESGWSEPLRWNRKAEREGVRRRVFCGSLMDFFERSEHEPSARAQQAAALRVRDLWARTPWLDWLILTKRVDGARAWLHQYGPLPVNVCLGWTAEDQKCLDARTPFGLQIPAAVRFVSYEPGLGSVDFRRWLPGWNVCEQCDWIGRDDGDLAHGPAFPCPNCGSDTRAVPMNESLDWIIAGGETGPGARPMHPEDVCSIRDQCVAAGVPFFFKSWGEWCPVMECTVSESILGRTQRHEFPDGKISYRVGKKRAGRLLDGRTWDEMPTKLLASVRRCRVCGCTDDRACEGGCYWIEADLCSRCAGPPAA